MIIRSILIAGLLLVVAACTPKTNGDASFDRRAMLAFYADSLIKPGFTQFLERTQSFETKLGSFQAVRNEENLRELQLAWVQLYSAWQQVNAYNFGPAGADGLLRTLAEEIGTWPVNTVSIEQRIAASQTSFNDFARDTRGLLAIEYLLFDASKTNPQIAADLNNPARFAYLQALTTHLRTRIASVEEAWRTSYRETFTKADGTDAGSSVSQLYNEFVKSFESIKNFKVGVPLGLQAGQSRSEPDRVEALYSSRSFEFMELHLRSLERVWSGGSSTAPSFKAYLLSIPGGEALVASTMAQLNVIYGIMNQIDKTVPFSEQIRSNPAALYPLHTELQRHTRFFKSEMSSLLGISITYSSGDGD
jgi:predicted lipoprotein